MHTRLREGRRPHSTDARVRATLHGALVRGYATTPVSDAHTTYDATEWAWATPQDAL
jgi:hypothetical protein